MSAQPHWRANWARGRIIDTVISLISLHCMVAARLLSVWEAACTELLRVLEPDIARDKFTVQIKENSRSFKRVGHGYI